MVARLPQEEVAVGLEPLDHSAKNAGRLLVAEVHEEPIAEDHVEGPIGELQPDGDKNGVGRGIETCL